MEDCASLLYPAMHYRVFYFFEASGRSVSSTRPVEMSAERIQKELITRLESADDYLGILDARENVLQILRHPAPRDRYWVELPLEQARASYGRSMALSEVRELILDLPRVFEPSAFPDMEYRPW